MLSVILDIHLAMRPTFKKLPVPAKHGGQALGGPLEPNIDAHGPGKQGGLHREGVLKQGVHISQRDFDTRQLIHTDVMCTINNLALPHDSMTGQDIGHSLVQVGHRLGQGVPVCCADKQIMITSSSPHGQHDKLCVRAGHLPGKLFDNLLFGLLAPSLINLPHSLGQRIILKQQPPAGNPKGLSHNLPGRLFHLGPTLVRRQFLVCLHRVRVAFQHTFHLVPGGREIIPPVTGKHLPNVGPLHKGSKAPRHSKLGKRRKHVCHFGYCPLGFFLVKFPQPVQGIQAITKRD